MRRPIIAALLIGGVLAGTSLAVAGGEAPSPAAPASGNGHVKMDSATQARLGVTIARLVAVRQSVSGASGYATVLDPLSLAELDGEIAQTQAALAASQAEADRSRTLNAANNLVSQREAEAAAAVFRADQAKLTLARRRLAIEWGPAIAALSDSQRAELIDALAAGRAALVRIDSLDGVMRAGGSVTLNFSGVGPAHAAILGPARTADANLRSPGELARVTGPVAARLSKGLTGNAQLGGGGVVSGVVIPRTALVRRGGQTFAYVRVEKDGFERRAINGGVFRPDGLFAPSGFRAGEEVALTGGGALLAAEVGAPEADDE